MAHPGLTAVDQARSSRCCCIIGGGVAPGAGTIEGGEMDLRIVRAPVTISFAFALRDDKRESCNRPGTRSWIITTTRARRHRTSAVCGFDTGRRA
jgi:hypothetical protein